MGPSRTESFLFILPFAALLFASETLAQTLIADSSGRRTAGQGGPETLQVGTAMTRTLSRGQTQRFNIDLQAEEIAEIVVDQRGIDVIVCVNSADGKPLAEFDSPNGTVGPENVSVVAVSPGTYSIDVFPLVQ